MAGASGQQSGPSWGDDPLLVTPPAGQPAIPIGHDFGNRVHVTGQPQPLAQVVAGEADVMQDVIVEQFEAAQLTLGKPAANDSAQIRKGIGVIPESRLMTDIVAHDITKLSQLYLLLT
jgi:hypothetical protein